jgi:hypothetical protein
MFVSKLKAATAVLLAVATLGGAGTFYRYRALAGVSPEAGGAARRPPALVAEGRANADRAGPEGEPAPRESAGGFRARPAGEPDDLAQQAPREGDGPAGFGGGFGSGSGFGGGFGFGFGSGQGTGFGAGAGTGGNKLGALSQKPVQRELRLSEKQLKKVRELQIKQQQALRRMVPQDPLAAFRDPGAAMRDLRQAPERMKQLAKEIDTAIDDMLSAKQGKRLLEIVLQQQGGHALADPEVADALGLTKDQRQQIQEIEAEGMKEMQELGLQTMT